MQAALADAISVALVIMGFFMMREKPQDWPMILVFLVILALNKLMAVQHVKYHVGQYMPEGKVV